MRLRALTPGPPGGCARGARVRRHRRQVSGSPETGEGRWSKGQGAGSGDAGAPGAGTGWGHFWVGVRVCLCVPAYPSLSADVQVCTGARALLFARARSFTPVPLSLRVLMCPRVRVCPCLCARVHFRARVPPRVPVYARVTCAGKEERGRAGLCLVGGRRRPGEPTWGGGQLWLNFLIQLPLEHTSLDSFPGMEVGHWQFRGLAS